MAYTVQYSFNTIANVSFLSKIIEKIVAYQLTCHLERNNLLPSCYGAIDRSELTFLALFVFDVSAAFDTVDHDILLERLHVTFGLHVSGGFLEWLNSFLTGRTLSVVHGPTRSGWVPAPYGLPQGSILGRLLYWGARWSSGD